MFILGAVLALKHAVFAGPLAHMRADASEDSMVRAMDQRSVTWCDASSMVLCTHRSAVELCNGASLYARMVRSLEAHVRACDGPAYIDNDALLHCFIASLLHCCYAPMM